MAEGVAALEVLGIGKSFGPVVALREVSFSAAPGEVHALLGHNGAGKSTLLKILLGACPADQGEMRLSGAPYRPRHPGEARRLGVVMVPQERTLCEDLSVAENIVLGIEPSRGPWLKRSEGRSVAARALTLVAGDTARFDLDRRAGDLPVADRQLVEIARALAQGGAASGNPERACVLLLDEPTSSLGHDDGDRLFTRVKALKQAGLCILLVTHSLSEVRAHADRYTVLRDGRVEGTGDATVTPPEQIVEQMLGPQLLSELRDRPSKEIAPETGPLLLRVDRLAAQERVLEASFELHRGEILGIAGRVGSGRTELLRAILGLDRPAAGSITLSEAPGGIGMLSEDRGGEGLMLGRSIAENVGLSRRGPWLSRPRALLDEGARWIRELSVRASGPDQPVRELSGGNQQKLQVARLLREDHDVLLVDEPTRGIDTAAKAQVLDLLRALAHKGKGILLVSSDLEELLGASDRICVLARGRLGKARPASSWDSHTLLLETSS